MYERRFSHTSSAMPRGSCEFERRLRLRGTPRRNPGKGPANSRTRQSRSALRGQVRPWRALARRSLDDRMHLVSAISLRIYLLTARTAAWANASERCRGSAGSRSQKAPEVFAARRREGLKKSIRLHSDTGIGTRRGARSTAGIGRREVGWRPDGDTQRKNST